MSLLEDLKARLRPEEGFRPRAYKDSRGVLTIGEGFNLTRPDADALLMRLGLSPTAVRAGAWAITYGQAEELLDYCAQCAITDAGDVVGRDAWERLPDTAKLVLADMTYNMGAGGLWAFQRMLTALRRVPPDFAVAEREMQDSLWDKQVGVRADELEHLIHELIPVITAEDRARVIALVSLMGRLPAGAHADEDEPPEPNEAA